MPTPGTMLYTCPHQAPCSIHAHTRHHALYMPTPGTVLYTCPHRRHRMHIHIRRIICVPDMVPCTTHQTCAAPSTCVGEYHPSTILVPSQYHPSTSQSSEGGRETLHALHTLAEPSTGPVWLLSRPVGTLRQPPGDMLTTLRQPPADSWTETLQPSWTTPTRPS